MITEQLQEEIISFYLMPNLMKDVAIKYNITTKILRRILRINNIPKHSKEVVCELRKKTYFEKYGCEHPMKNCEVKEKHKNTCLKNYGVSNVSCSEEIKNKKKQSSLQKYGVPNPNQSDSIKQKKRDTCINRYGVETPFQCIESRVKAKKTYMQKFGVNNPGKSSVVKEKRLSTCLKRYGCSTYTQTEECKLKTKKTNNLRYNCDSYAQTVEFHKKAKKHYIYLNEYFDSFPELCFYLYHIKNGISIERLPTRLLFIFENKKHFYIPDFRVGDKLIEIKGDQFLGEDGTWRCPFNPDLDELFEAKHRCALINNVEILYGNDYKKYIDWFNTAGYKKKDFIV